VGEFGAFQIAITRDREGKAFRLPTVIMNPKPLGDFLNRIKERRILMISRRLWWANSALFKSLLNQIEKEKHSDFLR
jgi:hypothetical protein